MGRGPNDPFVEPDGAAGPKAKHESILRAAFDTEGANNRPDMLYVFVAEKVHYKGDATEYHKVCGLFSILIRATTFEGNL